MTYERKTIDLFISEELKALISEFESDSEVAKLLLKKRHNKEDLVDSPINYISVSTADKNRLSYLTVDRQKVINEDEYWSSSRRYNTKPGSFVTKIFKNVNAKEIEKFSNLYKSQINKPKFSFSIVKGEDIRKYYKHDSYASGSGTLGVSCMKHDHCQRYLDVYVNNEDVINMLIMLDENNRLIGRALLWSYDSIKVMDRIYTTNDTELQFYFKKWAMDNGYMHKSDQNWYNTVFFEQLGKNKKDLRYSIKLNTENIQMFPYMDTFKCYEPETGYFYNYMPENKQIKILCSSDGTLFNDDYLRFDGIDNVFRYRGEAVFLNYLNLYTYANNIQWSYINGEVPILKKDCIYDEELGDYIFNKEFDHLNNKERIEERKNKNNKIKKERLEKFKNASNEPAYVTFAERLTSMPRIRRRSSNEDVVMTDGISDDSRGFTTQWTSYPIASPTTRTEATNEDMGNTPEGNDVLETSSQPETELETRSSARTTNNNSFERYYQMVMDASSRIMSNQLWIPSDRIVNRSENSDTNSNTNAENESGAEIMSSPEN